MEFIEIGKIVNTHGIKGEIRIELRDILLLNLDTLSIASKDEIISKIFKINNSIHIGEYKDEEKITSYRHHKTYEMITLEGINDINDVLKYKGKYCYVFDTCLAEKNSILLSNLINYEVIYNEETLGIIDDYRNNNGNVVLEISKNNDNCFVPINNHFIEKIVVEEKKLYVKNMEGLI